MKYETAREALPRLTGLIAESASVESLYCGGSLMEGRDDAVSDLDLWVPVEAWSPDQAPGLFLAYQSMTIGGRPFFHGVDPEGVVLDVMVGPEPWPHYKPCTVGAVSGAGGDQAEPSDIYTEFWINSYKSRKPLFRGQAAMVLFGLRHEAMLLLRAWVEHDTGSDPGPGAFTIHGLGPIVEKHLTAERCALIGLPLRDARECIYAIDAYREAMLVVMQRPSDLAELVLNDPVYNEERRKILA